MDQLPKVIQSHLFSYLLSIFELGRLSLVCKSYKQIVEHSPLWDMPLSPNPSGSIFSLTTKCLSISGGFSIMKPKFLRDVRKWHFAFHRSHWVPFSYRELPLCRPFLEILDLYTHVKLSTAERYILPAVLAGMSVISRNTKMETNTEMETFFAFLVGTIQGLISGDGVAIIVKTPNEKNSPSIKDIEKLAKPLCLSCCDCTVSDFPTETDRIILGTSEQLISCVEKHHIKNTQIRFCIIIDSQNDFKSHPFQSILSLLLPSTQLMVQSNVRNIISDSPPEKNSGIVEIDPKLENIGDFEDLNLEENLLRGVYSTEFQQPSPIHRKAILPAMLGEDIDVHSSDRFDMSLCYIISTLYQVNPSKPTLQALIIVRGQTSIKNTENLFNDVGKFLTIKTITISEIPNNFSIPEGTHVVITLSRHFTTLKEILKFQELKILVLDGIPPDVSLIFQQCPSICQVQIYTEQQQQQAESHDIEKYIHRPLKYIVGQNTEYTLEGMRQFYVNCDREAWKVDVFYDLMDTIRICQVVVYCNTRRKSEWLYKLLTEKEFPCSLVYRGMDRQEMNGVFTQFRSGSTRILISSFPIAQYTVMCSLILLFDLPSHCEDYVHMIGRSGKFGRKGVVILFVAEDIKKMNELEQYYRMTITELPANIDDYI